MIKKPDARHSINKIETLLAQLETKTRRYLEPLKSQTRRYLEPLETETGLGSRRRKTRRSAT